MRALVVNMGSPETDRLAAELSARGQLTALVRRYANQGRWWEQALARLPGIGGAYRTTFGRRVPPAGLKQGDLREAGVLSDFAFAAAGRVSRRMNGSSGALATHLLRRTESAVARRGADFVDHADVVVANYHVALPAFRRARKLGRRTVLNYPIAHHGWQYREYARQARCRPEFAAALPQFGDVHQHAQLLDSEIALADRILVGSHFVRDTFVEQGVAAERLRVVPYGVDTARFSASRGERDAEAGLKVLFVGQIGERKGISYLLDAWERLRARESGPNRPALHLVGDFVTDRGVYARYEGLYRHTPNVPQADLPALLAAADVFVLPTLVEGMPMVVIEAMACGLPVIATPRGPDEVVRDGVDGFIVPVCDSGAIADRLSLLDADRALLRRMSVEAKLRAATWTWSRYATQAAEQVLGD